MAGSHRASRGGGRAAAREARRLKARKRNQTIAAGVAVVVLVGGGGVAALNAFGGDKEPGAKAGNGPSDDKPTNSDVLADDKALLDAASAKTLGATGTWAVTKTADGDSAPDSAFACQSQRFADPSGLRTWVRTLQNSATKDTAVQYVDVSNDKATAAKTYTTVVHWLSQCTTPQTRLSAGYVTTGVGERGVIAVFGQVPGAKTKYKTVAVTLVGQATMVVEHDTLAAAPPRPDTVLATASAAAKKICAQTGGCATGEPVAKPALLPNTDAPGFMASVDLPLLDEIDKPWVSAPATSNDGTGCEKLGLKKAKATKYGTVTYVTPEAKVPTEFGFDDTVIKFATPTAAASYVSQIKKNVDACEKNVSNAKVESTGTVKTNTMTGKSWKATYDTGDGKKFVYRIGIAGSGNRAVYVLFPVLKELDLTNAAFNETLARAADRSAAYQ
ncbi:hypothetical protein EV137_4844 [Kribbella pratensis]|uniref:Sensor domain-containing protein n=1 Tax=Kribbella pratensis TaxID=2512112 RepID=A0ABY2FI06_9ACTN|nr:hypothetical protein [Kribbella pratensis]TDW91011.1 hypothetical protein EV137_4844 [Kribbella pratensis]